MTAPTGPTHIRAYVIFRDLTIKERIQTKVIPLMEKISDTSISPNSSKKATDSGTKKDKFEIFDIDFRDPLLLKICKPSPPGPVKRHLMMEPKAWDERCQLENCDYHMFLGGSVTDPDSSTKSSRRIVDRFFLKVCDCDPDTEVDVFDCDPYDCVYEDTDPGPESLEQVKLVQEGFVNYYGPRDVKSVLEEIHRR